MHANRIFLFRDVHRQKRMPAAFNIPSTFPELSSPSPNKSKNLDELFCTPRGLLSSESVDDSSLYQTPGKYKSQISNASSNSDYKTPDNTFGNKEDVFSTNFLIQKSSTVPHFSVSDANDVELRIHENLDNGTHRLKVDADPDRLRHSCDSKIESTRSGVLRSKSDFEIPKALPVVKSESRLQNFIQKSDSLLSFLTPMTKRRVGNHSTPNNNSQTANKNGTFLVQTSPIPKPRPILPEHKTTSLNSLRMGNVGECLPGVNAQRYGHILILFLFHHKLHINHFDFFFLLTVIRAHKSFNIHVFKSLSTHAK